MKELKPLLENSTNLSDINAHIDGIKNHKRDEGVIERDETVMNFSATEVKCLVRALWAEGSDNAWRGSWVFTTQLTTFMRHVTLKSIEVGHLSLEEEYQDVCITMCMYRGKKKVYHVSIFYT